MRRWGILGLLAMLGGGPGCTSSTFSCADDEECGAEGACEAGGWCSFPDGACPSGRRYGEHSGDGLGGACVDPSSGSSSTMSPLTTATASSGSATSDASTSGEAGSTTVAVTTVDPTSGTTGAAESTGDASTSTSSGSTSSGSSESTGDPQPACQGFIDTFDDGQIDPYWELWGAMGEGGHTMTEADGALRWAFTTDIVQQRGVQRILQEPFGRVRVHVSEAPVVPGSAAQLVLAVREYDSSVAYFMVWAGDTLSIRDGMGIEETVQGVSWVDAQRNADGTLSVSTSADGVSFEPQLTFGNGITEDGVWITLYGQTWTASTQEGAGAVAYVEICEP